MSIAKDYMAYREIAEKILFEIGAISACEIHDDFKYRTSHLTDDEVYAYATNYLKQSEYYKSYSNMIAFHDAIKWVLDSVAIFSECPYCE